MKKIILPKKQKKKAKAALKKLQKTAVIKDVLTPIDLRWDVHQSTQTQVWPRG